MENKSENPYIPIIIDEIKSSSIYLRFLQVLREYGIKAIYDCHAHISSGRKDTTFDDTSGLMPRVPFAIDDVNYLYDELFRREGISFTSVVFDTPLPAYDLVKKNEQLLQLLQSMDEHEMRKTVPFAVVTPDMDYRQIQRWVESGARGFKMTPRTASPHVKRGVISDITLTDMLNPEALWIANQHGLPLVVHLPQLVVSPRMKPSLKDELLQIAAKYPNLKIILAHLGQAQTPAKMEDLLALIDLNDLSEIIWMDISAVTVPSVLAMAFESNAKLLFGTDIDFALVERGRYIMFRVADGKRVLVDDEYNGNVITALVSQNFGEKLKSFALESGIILDAPLLLFQFEGILDAVAKLESNGRDQVFIKTVLENLFYRNAETLFSN